MAAHVATFGELIDAHQAEILRYLVRLTGNRDTADDLFQETFLRAFRARESFRGERGFRPWLYAIARNLCRDAIKERARRPAIASIDSEGETPLAETLPDRSAADPADALERTEVAEAVRSAVARLSVDHREVVVMRMFRRMSFDEIARITGDSAGTLRSRLFYALRKLRVPLESIARREGYLK